MPSAKRFVLKDSHPAVLAAGKDPKGRSYNSDYATQPGGIKLEEVTLGVELACLSITDDKPDTLKKVVRTMPWHHEALAMILESEEEPYKPLSEILKTHFNLDVDHFIDVSGLSKAGHWLDTQGYIAHNDEMIVLAYRCTTSGFDWLTNLSTTSSAWEIEEDVAQGHSGYISCIAGCCGSPSDVNPRVHTGFYNNMLVTVPLIREYIEPLLQPDQPPRKLFVVGHSLGAGVATLAHAYLLFEHDWAALPHKLILVTAGAPRSCCTSMQEKIDERMRTLRPLDKAVICRVVRDKDGVSTVPPASFGFRHVEKLVYITKDGAVLINPSLDRSHVVGKWKMDEIMEKDPSVADYIEIQSNEDRAVEQTKYEKRVKMIPRSLRDHMPDFYLQPLLKRLEKERGLTKNAGNENSTLQQSEEKPGKDTASPVKDSKASEESETGKKPRRRMFRLFGGQKKTVDT